MDRAKAIRLLSIQYNAMKSKYLMDVECGEKPDREYEFYLDAFDMAITALREQEQREQEQRAQDDIDYAGLAKDLNITPDVINRYRRKNCGRKLGGDEG